MNTIEPYSYDSIRPYFDHEVPAVVEQLIDNDQLRSILSQILSEEQLKQIYQRLATCQSVTEFKQEVGGPIVRLIAERTTFSVSLSGASHMGGDLPTTFVTNHRDIILDSAFLNLLMSDRGYRMPRIAIGDNLFGLPWIEPLVKLNDSFVVRRNLPIRQMLLAAQSLSQFIDQSITQDLKSVWIAQREGRAKDNTDHTQPSIIKMLTAVNPTHPIEQLQRINIAPATLSYEYDPCDILKAYELLTREKYPNERYIKAPGEDILNMKTGLEGQKGRVHVAIGTRLNELLTPERIAEIESSPKSLYNEVAHILDCEIHRNYRFYPINYIAYDKLYPNQCHPDGLYSPQDVEIAERYWQQQLSKVPGTAHSNEELLYKMYQIYAQPILNAQQVQGA